jgi:hypothetical protein
LGRYKLAALEIVKTNGKLDAERTILFSPFIQLDPRECINIFGTQASTKYSRKTSVSIAGQISGRDTKTSTTTIKLQSTPGDHPGELSSSPLVENLKSHLSKHKGRIFEAATAFKEAHRAANKDVFYPLVADLFGIIGFECKASRHGVNYERSDAFITHPKESVPIEIKSPGEELNISTKGVRQALENKIILLSRKYQPTLPETTTLVVGFELPNSRAEVSDLISYVKSTYKLNIGVIDFQTLVELALQKITGKTAEAEKIVRLFGFMELKQI